MNKLLLKKYTYHIDNNKFNFKIIGNKTINFSKKYKFFQRNTDLKTLYWSDKIKELTNNKLKTQEIIPNNLYPKIVSLKELEEFDDNTKFFIKPIEGSKGEDIQVLTKKTILKKDIDYTKYFIQEYITPCVINERKYDIRMYYFVIKNNNDLVTFISQNGKIRLCKQKYNEGGEITNSNLLDDEILDDFQGSLYNLLPTDREEIINIMKELDKYLKPILNKITSNFINMYGIDLIKDNNNKIWILELNGNPNWQIKQDSKNLNELKTEIFDEVLKILSNYYYKTNYDLEYWKNNKILNI